MTQRREEEKAEALVSSKICSSSVCTLASTNQAITRDTGFSTLLAIHMKQSWSIENQSWEMISECIENYLFETVYWEIIAECMLTFPGMGSVSGLEIQAREDPVESGFCELIHFQWWYNDDTWYVLVLMLMNLEWYIFQITSCWCSEQNRCRSLHAWNCCVNGIQRWCVMFV